MPPQNHASTQVSQAAPVAQSANVPFEALQTTINELSQELAGLKAEREVLDERIDGSQGEGQLKLTQQRSQLDARITTTEMQLQSAKAQLAARVGVSSELVNSTGHVVVPPPYTPRHGADPDLVVGLSFAFLMMVGLPLAIGYARRIWRGGAKPKETPAPAESLQRFERLEQAVDAIAIEIERVAEGQRFVTKIMAERPMPAPASPLSPVIDAQAANDAALADAKPFLALGAGPMEPIRVPERQTVKQSITPH
jgi:hypothetical protein